MDKTIMLTDFKKKINMKVNFSLLLVSRNTG